MGASVRRLVFVHLMTTGLLTLKHGSSKQMNHLTLSLSIKRTPHWLRKDIVFLRSLNAAPLMIAGKMPALMKFLIRTATMSLSSTSSTSSCASSSLILIGTGGATSPLAVISIIVMLLDLTTSSLDQAMMCSLAPTLRNEQGRAQRVMMVLQGTWISMGDGGLARDDQYLRQSCWDVKLN